MTPGGPGSVRPFAIGNPLDRPSRNDILFTPVGAAFQEGGGRVVVDLGPTLFERWQAGGRAGTGIRDLGRNQLEIVDPGRANIGNLVLGPGERLAFSLTFLTTVDTTKQFGLAVTQFGPDALGTEWTDLGGVEYQITIGKEQ